MLSSAVAAARTDVGAVRRMNEDAVLTAAPVFAVADGMGGHAAGDVAAALVLARLGELAGRDDLHPDDVLACIAQANADVVQRGRTDAATAGLGATLAGVCLGSMGGLPHWYVFNVGDARVYRLLDGRLHQLTVDHSEVQELVDAGEITVDEARTHPRRNVVTRSVGTVPAAEADMFVVPADAHQRFLICSDGLTAELTDDLIAVALRADTPAEAVDALVERALAAGARDNVSAVVVELQPQDERLEIDSASEITAPRPRVNGAAHA